MDEWMDGSKKTDGMNVWSVLTVLVQVKYEKNLLTRYDTARNHDSVPIAYCTDHQV